MADNELNNNVEQPVTKSEILDAMVNDARGVMPLSSCEAPGFAQACIEVEGRRYVVKLMEI